MDSTQLPSASSATTTLADVRAALASLAQPGSEAESVEQLQQLEAIKATAAAQQARAAALLEQYRLNDEAQRGVPKARWGKGLAAEIGLARGDSPARGAKHLQLANALTQDLPQTYQALQAGVIHEEHAQVVTTETAWLSTAHRRAVDARLAGNFTGLGPRELGATVRGHAQGLDQLGAVKRNSRARRQRRVSVRPAPEGMAYLTALLPMPQAVATYASLDRAATTRIGTGDTTDPADPTGPARTTAQLMADILVERATGQPTAVAVPAEVCLVIPETSLFGADATPAWVPGHGPVPASTAKHWLSDPDTLVQLRRIFTRPTDGQLVAMESRARTFPAGLRKMLLLRDGVCRTPYCDAPIRQADHITPVHQGGTTSWDNASGLCAACNQTKENTGWRHTGNPDDLTIETPTGHHYTTDTQPLFGTDPPELHDDDDGDPPPIRPTSCNLRIPRIEHTIHIAA